MAYRKRVAGGKPRVVLAHGPEIPDSPVAPSAMHVGMKRVVRMTIGRRHAPELEPLAQDAAQMAYRLLREMPAQNTAIASSVAAQARHRMLATFYANEALKAGPDTDRGMRFAECCQKHDLAAERLGVSAYDRAVHEARAAHAAAQRKDQESLTSIVTSSEPVED